MRKVLMIPLLAIATAVGMNAQDAPAKAFDFWVGAWDVSMSVAPKWNEVKAIDSVSVLLNGRLIEEVFYLADDTKRNFQRGYLSYLQREKRWKHTIYDASWGEYSFYGNKEGDKVILYSDPKTTRQGQRRETFYNITADGFEYLWEASYDGGKTWGAEWKVSYKRAK